MWQGKKDWSGLQRDPILILIISWNTCCCLKCTLLPSWTIQLLRVNHNLYHALSNTLYVSCHGCVSSSPAPPITFYWPICQLQDSTAAPLLQIANQFVPQGAHTPALWSLRFFSFPLQLEALEALLPEDMEADLQYLAFQKQTEGFQPKITASSFIQNESV